MIPPALPGGFLFCRTGYFASGEIKGPKVLVLFWRDGARRYLVVDESK